MLVNKIPAGLADPLLNIGAVFGTMPPIDSTSLYFSCLQIDIRMRVPRRFDPVADA